VGVLDELGFVVSMELRKTENE